MAQYLFGGFDPVLRERLVDGRILAVGSNFGIGSSREHVPLAMQGSGKSRCRRPQLRADLLPNCVNRRISLDPARRRLTA